MDEHLELGALGAELVSLSRSDSARATNVPSPVFIPVGRRVANTKWKAGRWSVLCLHSAHWTHSTYGRFSAVARSSKPRVEEGKRVVIFAQSNRNFTLAPVAPGKHTRTRGNSPGQADVTKHIPLGFICVSQPPSLYHRRPASSRRTFRGSPKPSQREHGQTGPLVRARSVDRCSCAMLMIASQSDIFTLFVLWTR